MAAPGYDLYYLNVMGGPGERAWRACDDPSHAWVREAWAERGARSSAAVRTTARRARTAVSATTAYGTIGRPSRPHEERTSIRWALPKVAASQRALKRRWPDIRPEDRAAVAAVLERGILGGVGAPEMTALENEWAAFVGRSTGLLFNSGTAAIHAALYAIGIEPGRRGHHHVLHLRRHVAADPAAAGDPGLRRYRSRARSTSMPSQIEARITPRTRAIIAVHIGGLPADLDEILAIADRHGLKVIEDACQAHGATYRGRQVGSIRRRRLLQPELEQDPVGWRGRPVRRGRSRHHRPCPAVADLRRGHPRAGTTDRLELPAVHVPLGRLELPPPGDAGSAGAVAAAAAARLHRDRPAERRLPGCGSSPACRGS